MSPSVCLAWSFYFNDRTDSNNKKIQSYSSLPSPIPSPHHPSLLLLPFVPSALPYHLPPPLTRAWWNHLYLAAIARQSSQEEPLLSLGQFKKAYEELRPWLTDALRQPAEMEPITGDLDAVPTQPKVCTCLG